MDLGASFRKDFVGQSNTIYAIYIYIYIILFKVHCGEKSLIVNTLFKRYHH